MLLMIDNYDSFTYNLVQYFGELGQDVKVVRNDALTVAEIAALGPARIVISPGPCTPNEAGVSLEVLEKLSGAVPILGVCLGHQSLGQAFGGKVVRARTIMHGKTSPIHHAGTGRVRRPAQSVRGHALPLAGRREGNACPTAWRSPPGPSTPTAASTRSWACAIETLAVEGVQFHPESILTEHGHDMLRNFLGRLSLQPCQSPRMKPFSASSTIARSSTTRWST